MLLAFTTICLSNHLIGIITLGKKLWSSHFEEDQIQDQFIYPLDLYRYEANG